MSDTTSLQVFPDEAKVAVVSSWDEGSKYDVRLARVLDQYGWKGTFFLSPGKIGTEGYLDAAGVQKIVSFGNEIGWLCPDASIETLAELASKKRSLLEEVTGAHVKAFAFPHNSDVDRAAITEAVRSAGFQIGRTTDELDMRLSTISDWLATPVTARAMHDHEDLRERWETIETPGDGIFHLWGRSSECADDDDAWATLECNLAWFCGHLDVWYGTLSELYELRV